MANRAPIIDGRGFEELCAQLASMAPHHAPAWKADLNDEHDPGVALVRAYGKLAERLLESINAAPEQKLLWFLSAMGLKRPSASPARVPVRFYPAPGARASVPVSRGAQLVASPPEGERVTFETESALLMHPVRLQHVVLVDPEEDRIILPPPILPGFRESEPEDAAEAEAQLAAFASAESITIQLDRELALIPDDQLELTHADGEPVRVRVAAIDTTIVTATAPLGANVPAGAAVRRVTTLTLFDGINRQEHILYLSENELFNLKEAAVITVALKLMTGSGHPIKGNWSYYGTPKGDDTQPGWTALVAPDGAGDWTTDASIILQKSAGSIDEYKVNGVEGRWIRFVAKGPIRASWRDQLPMVETMRITIASGEGVKLIPEQAFHNNTPLTLPTPATDEDDAGEDAPEAKPVVPWGHGVCPETAQEQNAANGAGTDEGEDAGDGDSDETAVVGFYPLGTEPRLFDSFYLSSAEAFSKRGAKVELSFTIDEQGQLGPPVAVADALASKVSVFAVGGNGQLFEYVTGAGETFVRRMGRPDEATGEGPTPQDQLGNLRLTTERPLALVGVWAAEPLIFGWAGTAVSLEPSPTELESPIAEIVVARRTGSSIWWKRMGNPDLAAKALQSAIAAAVTANAGLYLFVVSQGKLFHTRLTAGTVEWKAAEPVNGEPGPANVFGDPVAVAETGPGPNVCAVVIGDTGAGTQRHIWVFRPNKGWTKLTADASLAVAEEQRPAVVPARVDNESALWVFVRDNADTLWGAGPVKLDADTVHPTWRDMGQPDNNGFGSDPSVWIEHPNEADVEHARPRVFALDGSSRLATRHEVGDGSAWTRLSVTAEIKAGSAPFVVELGAFGAERRVSVFVASLRRSLHHVRFSLTTLFSGQAGISVNRVARLSDPIPNYNAGLTYDIEMDAQQLTQAVTIDRYDVARKTLTTTDPFPTSPAEKPYRVARQVDGSFTAARVEDTECDLPAEDETTVAGSLIEMQVNGQTVRALVYTAPPVQDPPQSRTIEFAEGILDGSQFLNVEYAVLEVVSEGRVDLDHQQAIVLKDDVAALPGSLEDVSLSVTGLKPYQQIVHFSSVSLVAELTKRWNNTAALDLAAYQLLASTAFSLDEIDEKALAGAPEISWEYWNGSGWLALDNVRDLTKSLSVSETVKFKVPMDLGETEVAGQKGFWIRMRLVGGDYGQPSYRTIETPGNGTTIYTQEVSRDSVNPPYVLELTLRITEVPSRPPEVCGTWNNLTWRDQTAACSEPGVSFAPFEVIEATVRALYLGFDAALEGSAVNVFFDADETEYDDLRAPEFVWAHQRDRAWITLTADDDSAGLTRRGVISLSGDLRTTAVSLFGSSRHWLRATERLPFSKQRVLSGIHPNCTWAVQATTRTNEILGSSDGEGKQRFAFAKSAVLSEEVVRVREILSSEEIGVLRKQFGDEVVAEPIEGEHWVQWTETEDLSASERGDRHYAIDRASGAILFGDGKRGRAVPVGVDNVRAFSYQHGGGESGNVELGGIDKLSTAIAGVASVRNPVAAGGGTESVATEAMRDLGPAALRHRGRAAVVADYERLAVDSSRLIARARCLPGRDKHGKPAPGAITVVIVPQLSEARPQPTRELRRAVQAYLAKRCAATPAAADRLAIVGPQYVAVRVDVCVRPTTPDILVDVEKEVGDRIQSFLHPLTGGPGDAGWAFGRDVFASDVLGALRQIEGVASIVRLRLAPEGTEVWSDHVTVADDALAAPAARADHKVVVSVGGEC